MASDEESAQEDELGLGVEDRPAWMDWPITADFTLCAFDDVVAEQRTRHGHLFHPPELASLDALAACSPAARLTFINLASRKRRWLRLSSLKLRRVPDAAAAIRELSERGLCLEYNRQAHEGPGEDPSILQVLHSLALRDICKQSTVLQRECKSNAKVAQLRDRLWRGLHNGGGQSVLPFCGGASKLPPAARHLRMVVNAAIGHCVLADAAAVHAVCMCHRLATLRPAEEEVTDNSGDTSGGGRDEWRMRAEEAAAHVKNGTAGSGIVLRLPFLARAAVIPLPLVTRWAGTGRLPRDVREEVPAWEDLRRPLFATRADWDSYESLMRLAHRVGNAAATGAGELRACWDSTHEVLKDVDAVAAAAAADDADDDGDEVLIVLSPSPAIERRPARDEIVLDSDSERSPSVVICSLPDAAPTPPQPGSPERQVTADAAVPSPPPPQPGSPERQAPAATVDAAAPSPLPPPLCLLCTPQRPVPPSRSASPGDTQSLFSFESPPRTHAAPSGLLQRTPGSGAVPPTPEGDTTTLSDLVWADSAGGSPPPPPPPCGRQEQPAASAEDEDPIESAADDDAWLARRDSSDEAAGSPPTPLQCPEAPFGGVFTPRYVQLTVLAFAVSVCESVKDYERAARLLRILLAAHWFRPRKRGHWWGRLCLAMQHRQRVRQAQAVAVSALKDASARHWRPGDRLMLERRVQRLCAGGKKVGPRPLPEGSLALLAELQQPAETVVSADALRRPDYGARLPMGWRGKWDPASAAVVVPSPLVLPPAAVPQPPGPAPPAVVGATVEDAALEAYRQTGLWPSGAHSEGAHLRFLFSLLLWDIIYDTAVPGAFATRFQSRPLDFHLPDFFARRQEAVLSRCAAVSQMSPETLAAAVRAEWHRRHQVLLPGCMWDRSIEEVVGVASCVGGPALSRVFLDMAQLGQFAGLPDLVLWNESNRTALFAEVKGPGDKLSGKQECWLTRLNRHGIPAELCTVRLRNAEQQPRPAVPPDPARHIDMWRSGPAGGKGGRGKGYGTSKGKGKGKGKGKQPTGHEKGANKGPGPKQIQRAGQKRGGTGGQPPAKQRRT